MYGDDIYVDDFYYDDPLADAFLGTSIATSVISLIIAIAGIVALWMIFKKAGEHGWASIVPFYNLYTLYKITWGNGWFFLLLLIPFVNFVISIITFVKLAKVFGKGGGFACGLIFLNIIFLMILAFNRNIRYVGINGNGPQAAGGYNPNPGFQNPYQQSGQQNYQQQQDFQNPYQQQSNQGYYQQGYQQQNTYTQNPYSENQYQAKSSAEPCETNSSATETYNCPGCGEQLLPGIKYCPKCGRKQ